MMVSRRLEQSRRLGASGLGTVRFLGSDGSVHDDRQHGARDGRWLAHRLRPDAWLLTAALGFTTAALGTRQLWYFVGAFIAAVALGTLLARARRLTGAEAEALGGLLSSVDGKSTHDVRVC
jgi:hypothetical protein